MTTVEELCENFTKIGLIRECEKLGLPTTGGKMEIAEKIIKPRSKMSSNSENGDALEGEKDDDRCSEDDGNCEKDDSQHSGNEEHDEDDGPSTDDEDDDEDDNIDEGDSDSIFQTAIKATSTPKNPRRHAPKRLKVYSFRDMEDSIESFGAEEGEDVRMWLKQLKSVCKAARWDDEQQLIMCRKKLAGTARRFVFSLRTSFSSFAKLEKALIKEFAPRIRASDVHRALTNRKKKTTESLRDYIYEMQRLAIPIDLDEPSLCEYIVSGITDDEHHQSILLEAQSIERLKKKLLNFEKVTKTVKSKTKREEFTKKEDKLRPNEKANNKQIKKQNCFNCGETSHISSECPQKNEGPKCFSCNMFGHRARDCKRGSTGSKSAEKTNL
ncbi:uncharacterized protein LOC125774905 [Anopheles funestus]|uniref:uncharacterized protein LOC125774905 n=1 Tax=Anopheles funestus TaxID=62324 RepID=UPI0020C6DEC5|nr:uncharacterized protein LOC125774905 [Anopheles funestus]